MIKHVYLALCIAGAAIPYAAFLPWVAENGVDPVLMFRELFASRIGAFFGLDVLLSAAVLVVFLSVERRRLKMPLPWLPGVVLLLVGVSAALPLTLYLRELALQRSGWAAV